MVGWQADGVLRFVSGERWLGNNLDTQSACFPWVNAHAAGSLRVGVDVQGSSVVLGGGDLVLGVPRDAVHREGAGV